MAFHTDGWHHSRTRATGFVLEAFIVEHLVRSPHFGALEDRCRGGTELWQGTGWRIRAAEHQTGAWAEDRGLQQRKPTWGIQTDIERGSWVFYHEIYCWRNARSNLLYVKHNASVLSLLCLAWTLAPIGTNWVDESWLLVTLTIRLLCYTYRVAISFYGWQNPIQGQSVTVRSLDPSSVNGRNAFCQNHIRIDG